MEALDEMAQLSTLRVILVPSRADLAQAALPIVLQTLHMSPAAVISLTTGYTPLGLYSSICEHWRSGVIDMSLPHFVSSEEYLGVGADNPISLFGWLRAEVLDPCQVPPAAVLRLAGDARDPDGECRRFDEQLEAWGGIDLAIQTVGVNAHFGFNEPGSLPTDCTRVVKLDSTTIQHNNTYWAPTRQVPGYAFTLGVRQILQARHILLLAAGADKAEALERALHGPVTSAVPCSLLRHARQLTIIADQAAGVRLPLAMTYPSR